jgi:hypothetical protein
MWRVVQMTEVGLDQIPFHTEYAMIHCCWPEPLDWMSKEAATNRQVSNTQNFIHYSSRNKLEEFINCKLYAPSHLTKPVIYWNMFQILTYLLTPRCRVLPEKIKCPKLIKEFFTFYGTRRFITVYTRARHLSLSWARLIQSMPPIQSLKDPFLYYPPIYTWVFQAVYFPQVSPLKPCMHISSPLHVPHVLPISVFLTWSPDW